MARQTDSLPYDVVITPTGVWYGPAYTEPFSRDWQRWDHGVEAFFSIVTRPTFDLNVRVWKVQA